MKLWIARDEDGELKISSSKPKYIAGENDVLGEYEPAWWFTSTDNLKIDRNEFPEVTFENSPQEVELKLKEKESK